MTPLEMVEAEKQRAIQAGWDATKAEWRKMALIILMNVCLSQRTLSLNDFRDRIRDSSIKTDDYRALGGLMVMARKWGWIVATGRKAGSLVAHKVPINEWESKIYQEPSRRELAAERQALLFP